MSTPRIPSDRFVEEDCGGFLRLVLKLDVVTTGAVELLSLAVGSALLRAKDDNASERKER